jgi:peroxiredoxin
MNHFVIGALFSVLFLSWNVPTATAQFSEAGVQKLEPPITAPDFTLKVLEGREISLKELRGKIIVLNFFSSWCPICRGEFLSFEKLHKEFKDNNVVFLKVAVKGKETELISIRNKSNITSPILIDDDGSAAGAYGVGHHETFFISCEGKILGRTFSQKDWASESMKNLIRHLLVEKK